MLRYGYDRRLASGVIAASGTLAQIIPPSLVLIIMADQLGRSVGDMYAGAFIPGAVLTGLYLAYVALVTLIRPDRAPALPLEARTLREPDGGSGIPSLLVLLGLALAAALIFEQLHYEAGAPIDAKIVVTTAVGMGLAFGLAVANRLLGLKLLSRIAERVTFVLIPPLALVFLVLGTIFLGVATPTEGGAMGATGALIMALARRRLSSALLRQATESTAKLSAFVMFILIGARVFSLTFYGVNGHLWVEHLLAGLPGRRARLPHRCQPAGLRAGLLPRLLRAGLHHRARCWARWRTSSASTWSGSVSCWRSTCRPPSCTHPSASPSSTCAAWPRPGAYLDKLTGGPWRP